MPDTQQRLNHWTEETLSPRVDTLDGAVAADATVLRPHNAHWFKIGDVVHSPRTDDTFKVTDVNITKRWKVQGHERSEGTITVERGLGPQEPCALVDQEMLWILGSAEEVTSAEGDEGS